MRPKHEDCSACGAFGKGGDATRLINHICTPNKKSEVLNNVLGKEAARRKYTPQTSSCCYRESQHQASGLLIRPHLIIQPHLRQRVFDTFVQVIIFPDRIMLY